MALPNVSGHHSICWGSEKNKKGRGKLTLLSAWMHELERRSFYFSGLHTWIGIHSTGSLSFSYLGLRLQQVNFGRGHNSVQSSSRRGIQWGCTNETITVLQMVTVFSKRGRPEKRDIIFWSDPICKTCARRLWAAITLGMSTRHWRINRFCH